MFKYYKNDNNNLIMLTYLTQEVDGQEVVVMQMDKDLTGYTEIPNEEFQAIKMSKYQSHLTI